MPHAILRDLITGFVSLVYPPHCLLCHAALASEAAEWLCAPCWDALPENHAPWCLSCGQSLAGLGRDVACCATCRRTPLPVAWSRAACRYEGAAKACVVTLKYHRQLGLVGPMARRMVAAARRAPALASGSRQGRRDHGPLASSQWGDLPSSPPPAGAGRMLGDGGDDWPADALIPVPLHPVRQRERTFNQAAALAQAVGRTLGLPVLEGLLIRARATALQASLHAQARRRNVAGAFALRPSARLRGRRVVLVDDVLTTGATIRACARVLAAAGARRVGVLTFAHG